MFLKKITLINPCYFTAKVLWTFRKECLCVNGPLWWWSHSWQMRLVRLFIGRQLQSSFHSSAFLNVLLYSCQIRQPEKGINIEIAARYLTVNLIKHNSNPVLIFKLPSPSKPILGIRYLLHSGYRLWEANYVNPYIWSRLQNWEAQNVSSWSLMDIMTVTETQ